jgi:hypothetical protein
MKYWQENPPLRLMINHFLGVKGTRGTTASPPPKNTGDITGMLGGAGVWQVSESILDRLMAPYLDKKGGNG